jgi:hypothetical protein
MACWGGLDRSTGCHFPFPLLDIPKDVAVVFVVDFFLQTELVVYGHNPEEIAFLPMEDG